MCPSWYVAVAVTTASTRLKTLPQTPRPPHTYALVLVSHHHAMHAQQLHLLFVAGAKCQYINSMYTNPRIITHKHRPNAKQTTTHSGSQKTSQHYAPHPLLSQAQLLQYGAQPPPDPVANFDFGGLPPARVLPRGLPPRGALAGPRRALQCMSQRRHS